MRIVGGRFRGTALATPKSQDTRPTSDRLRETLFNILVHGDNNPVHDARVLDLFAGTGALGIEAMSRGARYCTFVEMGVEGRGLIRSNIEATGLMGATKILRRDATALGVVGTMEPFSLVFMDPPYLKELGEAALASAIDGGWLSSGAVIVWEEDARAALMVPQGCELVDQRKQGDSQIALLRYTG
ncbi:16S rRNA (guanine(966)-N(2))-methyltransferase RsmD [Pseudovibrio exalbescens]|uniref:16S rRNA (Guanine(966)-N(2))-methyltransferase RsmD n=1 Tax=Pseudovibrio exalbescens TaxID=197461 RepID=A0A1U7JCI8_9HYPH|nr:16S rRNA (guanine(966)-N(2))-methyltransferase RsmD [Pseudovibrio exalbescens]OKL42470.1 16S rRNA (guanine(966)-N(2))-methyltransferase RsmD [Pseudovibrio exalbescens]